MHSWPMEGRYNSSDVCAMHKGTVLEPTLSLLKQSQLLKAIIMTDFKYA